MRTFDITGMSCSACSARVEKAVSSLDGVEYCSVNLLTNSMVADGSVTDEEIVKAVENAGYGASRSEGGIDSVKNLSKKEKKETRSRLHGLIISIILLIPLMYLGMGHMMFRFPLPKFFDTLKFLNPLLQAIFCLAVMIINRRFFISGFKAVKGLAPNMDTLVALGSMTSFVYSVVLFVIAWIKGFPDQIDYYFESAAMILVFVSIGKMLEARAKGKTTDALESLARLAPGKATVIVDGAETVIPAEEVKPGDIFVVRPGEKFPADGVVLEGISSADESAFTGESIPCEKEEGSTVLTASINLSGFLKCKAEKTGSDTALASIVKAANEAAATKAPVARMADKISAILVPSVIGIAIITFIIWMIAGKPFSFSLERAVAVLVITCPCSLGLATPVAITVANGIGARCGILYKNAEVMEILSRAKTIVLDKTGTVTTGNPEVTDLVVAEGFSEEEALSLVYSLEYKSEHPLGKAIVRYCDSRGADLVETEDFIILPGSGLRALIDGKTVCGGSLKYMTKNFVIPDNVVKTAENLSSEGKTPLIFTKNGEFLCAIAERDSIKQNAKETVDLLHELKLDTVLLTGDNIQTAKAIAAETGIGKCFAEVLPEEKAAKIAELKKDSNVAMVGDGINDAPALIAADTGIAIGAGADIAIDSADVVFLGSNVSDIALSVRISKRAMTNIRENLFWAFIYNLLCIPLAAGSFYPAFGITLSPMICALCMSVSSIFVVLNSLRLNFIFRKELSKRKNNDKETETMKKTLNVEGMMCEHCEARVKKTLESLPFVTSAEASHKKNRAVVEITEDGHDDELKAAVENEGYKVKGIN